MADTPYLGEIRLVSFNFPPSGWAFCNGQLMSINSNQPLFSLLGTMYGGDGRTTFALPNLQGRVAMHLADDYSQGQAAGVASHTLTPDQMPSHTHTVEALAATGTTADPTGALLASSSNLYRPPGDLTALHASSVTSVGGGQPHENRQPFLVLNYCIALVGVFPSQT